MLQAHSHKMMDSSLYKFGDCIGKGASAVVYKALMKSSGQVVAIKHIEITGLPPHELLNIMVCLS